MIDVIEHVVEVGKSIKNGRTTQDIAIKLAEESGEVRERLVLLLVFLIIRKQKLSIFVRIG